jgi:hypothetical protein
MLNKIKVYTEVGAKAGRARKHHDEATARSHIDWFRRAVRLEADTDLAEITEAFNAAYREEATPSVRGMI